MWTLREVTDYCNYSRVEQNSPCQVLFLYSASSNIEAVVSIPDRRGIYFREVPVRSTVDPFYHFVMAVQAVCILSYVRI